MVKYIKKQSSVLKQTRVKCEGQLLISFSLLTVVELHVIFVAVENNKVNLICNFPGLQSQLNEKQNEVDTLEKEKTNWLSRGVQAEFEKKDEVHYCVLSRCVLSRCVLSRCVLSRCVLSSVY